MSKLQASILKTLAYADVFNYPLTQSEIEKFLIGNDQIPITNFQKELTRLKKEISEDGSYYFLKGQKRIVDIRKKRNRWSREKLEIVRRAAGWLRLIPTIRMAAVTGALAMENSSQEDDIDLLIVTVRNRLWLTRLLTVLLIGVVAQRRKPGDKIVTDRICPNMFLDEDHLTIPKKERDLFTAHEVCQLRLLWDREGTYNRFIYQNRWVKKYLPNGTKKVRSTKYEVRSGRIENFLIFIFSFSFFEKLARAFQIRYMKSRRTTEIIETGRILFHPQDARRWILREYQKRLEKLGLPF